MEVSLCCVTSGGRCHATAGGPSSCFALTAIPRAVTSTGGNGIVFRDGQTESGASVGDADPVLGCGTLLRAATCVQQVWGDLGDSASCFALRREWRTEHCASFCAHPTSKTVALGSNQAGQQIASTRAENERDSKSSHSVRKKSATTVNRRVASSNLARGANFHAFKRL